MEVIHALAIMVIQATAPTYAQASESIDKGLNLEQPFVNLIYIILNANYCRCVSFTHVKQMNI